VRWPPLGKASERCPNAGATAYDIAHNEAWFSVGRDDDTPGFSVASLRQWCKMMGQRAYPDANQLFITAGAGGCIIKARCRHRARQVSAWATRDVQEAATHRASAFAGPELTLAAPGIPPLPTAGLGDNVCRPTLSIWQDIGILAGDAVSASIPNSLAISAVRRPARTNGCDPRSTQLQQRAFCGAPNGMSRVDPSLGMPDADGRMPTVLPGVTA
jgi:hypothetical protein